MKGGGREEGRGNGKGEGGIQEGRGRERGESERHEEGRGE